MHLLKKKNSIYTHGLLTTICGFIILNIVFSFSLFLALNKVMRSAEKTYKESANFFVSSLESKFDYINRKILIFNTGTNSVYYDNLFTAEDPLILENSKHTIKKKMEEIVLEANESCRLFIYVPDKDILISYGETDGIAENPKSLNTWLKDYLSTASIQNSQKWEIYQQNGYSFAGHIYQVQDGYIGAFIDFDNLMPDSDNAGNTLVQVQENTGNVVFEFGNSQLSKEKNITFFADPIRNANFRICYLISHGVLVNETEWLTFMILCSIAAGILLIILNIRIQIRRIIRPIYILKDAMEHFSHDGMTIPLADENLPDELSTLYKTFNTMESEIVNLKIESYENELDKRKIQNNYLNIQLQPHFYANIMNLIYGLAEIQDYQAIQELSTALAEYFRYMMTDLNQFITLEKELSCINSFIKIQNMRYLDKIILNTEIDSRLRKIKILPFLLLTFIENSIKHNITFMDSLKISLKVWQDAEKICLRISDNGAGFSNEILKKLNNNTLISEDGKHIGINNIIQRLKITYENDAQIYFYNRSNNGAEILINLKRNNEYEYTDC